ncbi:MAG: histidine phosphatase family protein [Gemmatimonadota bacterium]
MGRRLRLAGALAALASVAFGVPGSAQTPAPTVVVVVRHAEKASSADRDPSLSEAGRLRAQDLAHALAGAGIGAAVVTQFRRTIETARPTVAAASGAAPIPVDTVAVGGSLDAHIAAVASAVHRHAGRNVLVVGHSNTVTRIVEALGVPGPRLPDLCDGDYSELFTVVIPPGGGPARLIRSQYGQPAADAACQTMQISR